MKHFSEDEIVLTDEGPTTPSNFPLRFPSEADKRVAEEWAARLGYKSFTEYILAAIEAFNNRWAEQASFLQKVQLSEEEKNVLRSGRIPEALAEKHKR
ncbi:MAG: hypothetical protein HY710_14760 [Candidatus Latescibacteria bacterium]|nr:hypothetical protein [Candidatus Latescibacterota bacterium]